MNNLQIPANAGVVYISFGDVYRQMTADSISHLRSCGYAGPVRVLTDSRVWDLSAFDVEVVALDAVEEGFATRFYKTQVNAYGYDVTLFLDADTLPLSPLGAIWQQLRFAEICMATDLHPTVQHLIRKSKTGTDDWRGWGKRAYSAQQRLAEYDYMRALGLTEHPFFNSGVMLFRRCTATDRLFTAWHEEWKRFRDADQLPLVRAIAMTGCKVHTLAPSWNARLKYFGTIDNARARGVRILHLRPRASAPANAPAGRNFGKRLWSSFLVWTRSLTNTIGANVSGRQKSP